MVAHGDSIHKVIRLTGPNGHTRTISYTRRITVSRPREGPRFFFSQGWKPFAIENGFQTGDEVKFCLVGSSEFHVLHCAAEPRQIPTAPAVVRKASSPRLPYQRLCSHVREEEYSNYPGLKSATTANSKFPQFVKKLIINSKNSLVKYIFVDCMFFVTFYSS